MRFHVLSLPHTVTSKEYSACAFTQKVLKFCTMMHSRGHTVYHYGHERSQVDCTEHISVTNDEVLARAYGTYDWHAQQFKHNTSDAAHLYFNMHAAEEVAKRKLPGDFLLLFWGHGHAHVAKVHGNDMIVVEPGIGSYNKVIAPFAVFESYAVMSHVYAKHDMMPRWMDAVVPNYFDPKDFIDATGTIEETNVKIQDYITSHETSALSKPNVCSIQSVLSLKPRSYVLMIARMITTKGVQVAMEVCRTAGVKLILAGQGLPKDAVSKDFKIDFTDLDCPTGVTHIGYIEPLQRAILIANAKCLLAPTLYAEPFGGVNVEAQMSGVPAITTDWGAFAETVLHGVTGYRCRSMDHFLYALQNVDLLDRKQIRQWAHANYGLTKVATMYEEYFQMLATTKQGRGFYQENPGRLALKWLEKTYPIANK